MEKFLLIFCVVLSPITQGLPTKYKGSDILVRNVIDRLILQYGTEDQKRNMHTVASEEILVTNMVDNGGKDVFINGIQSVIEGKGSGHTGFGNVKRSIGTYDDLHGRGTGPTTQSTTSQSTPAEVTYPLITTTTVTTPPITKTMTNTTAAKTTTPGPII